MPHSHCRIWLHAVFTVKNREHFIIPESEQAIFHFMREQLIGSGCPVRIINGMPDHVHCLFLHNHTRSVSDVVKQMKGASSHWINHNNIIPWKFSWQVGFGAFSVSESQMDRVYHYIANQKSHHARQTFEHEYADFLKLHRIEMSGNG